MTDRTGENRSAVTITDATVSSSSPKLELKSKLDRVRYALRHVLLPLFCLAQLLDAMNISGVNVALPRIQRELDFTVSTLQWVISAYGLTFGGFLLLTGRLGDVYGHSLCFTLGLTWFAIFAVVSGVSTSSTMLIVARGLQGVGAAATIPNAVALIIQCYPIGRARNRAMALFASTGAIGFVLGLIVGGAITESAGGWRWTFHFSGIVAGCMALLALLCLPWKRRSTTEESRVTDKSAAAVDPLGGSTGGNAKEVLGDEPASAATEVKRPKIDVLGAALSTSSMLMLVFVLTEGNARGWSDPLILSLLIVSLVLLAAFAFAQLKTAEPLMPPAIWKLPNFAPSFVIALGLAGFFASYLYYVTMIFQELWGYGALQSAVRFLPNGILCFITAIFAERIVHHLNIKLALVGGLLLGVIGTVVLGFYKHEDQYWSIYFPSVVIAMPGLASVYSSVTIAAFTFAPADQAGIIGGVLHTAFQIGTGVVLAITTTVATAVTPSENASEDEILKGYHGALWAGCGILGICLLVAIVFLRVARPQKHDEEVVKIPQDQHEEMQTTISGQL
ncbi:major facilitator superfamily domain-containing protein [Gaertneriomyces semiglobifer]|nr:major facilitator superfamily domain-containing protein [Gaertneriomyces semiglobifer]